ncbi:hypothetical protein [Azohydromonas lata]|uniref:DUF3329 domain-containing protein n=1 Tax=Azohydromonas lata TaxID=45677 RepID=A0ABU5I964_9BURK|nr:hypothetical protein [Azohydromonas lata]MDZ5455641.1 hypothetical protein [Azohydromonas lata]
MDKSKAPLQRHSFHSWSRWIFAAFMSIALFLLWSEHRAHLLGWVLHALVGVCVLLLYLNTRACEYDGPDDDRPRP